MLHSITHNICLALTLQTVSFKSEPNLEKKHRVNETKEFIQFFHEQTNGMEYCLQILFWY